LHAINWNLNSPPSRAQVARRVLFIPVLYEYHVVDFAAVCSALNDRIPQTPEAMDEENGVPAFGGGAVFVSLQNRSHQEV
jgi:hypothetical protein